MQQAILVVCRRPYEEPYHTQLEFTASNGVFAGRTDIYCNVAEIAKIGVGLKNFASKVEEEFVYQYGSEAPSAKSYRYFMLRAYPTDGVGHCALQFAFNLNEAEPYEGVCRFSLPVEVVGLNRLGQLFEAFAELRHLELRWSGADGELYEQYQQPVRQAI